MDMRIGNCRHFIKLATVAKNQSYKVHVDYSDTYVEFSLGPDSSGKLVIVSSDECVDNRKIIVREMDGRFQVEMQPRVRPTGSTSTANKQECEPLKKRSCTLWRLWIF